LCKWLCKVTGARAADQRGVNTAGREIAPSGRSGRLATAPAKSSSFGSV